MGIPYDQLGQPLEELRGDYLELPARARIPTTPAGTALLVPVYLDGRLVYAPSNPGVAHDAGAVLRRIQLLFTAAVALNATNFWTVQLNRYNAGVLQGAAGALGSFSTATANVVARTPLDLGSASLAGMVLAAGDYLELSFAHSGAGALIPPGLCVLEYARLA